MLTIAVSGTVVVATKKEPSFDGSFFVWMQQRPIFPDRLQSSIVGADELNFCVRYENRWDLIANVTAMVYKQLSWIYLFCRCIYHTPFFESRQFLYTIDSQLHSSFF